MAASKHGSGQQRVVETLYPLDGIPGEKIDLHQVTTPLASMQYPHFNLHKQSQNFLACLSPQTAPSVLKLEN